jgi:putative ABC transport system permease protein
LSTVRLVLLEMWHRKTNSLLSLLAVCTAVALYVAFFSMTAASKRETTRLMRDLGFNLRIIPATTDMAGFWRRGYSEHSMPEAHAIILGSFRGLSYAHLTGVLQKRIQWRGRDALLTGIGPEVTAPGERRSPMARSIDPGTIVVGHELATSLSLEPNDRVTILNRTFEVAQTLSESGSVDDTRIFAGLRDVQKMLGMHGKINEIKALQCHCVIDGRQKFASLEQLREQLATALPDTKVILMQAIAEARKRQRSMVGHYFGHVGPWIAVACLAMVGVLAWLNVRERRQEIGTLRALGFGSTRVAGLFLVRAALLGLIGALIGFGGGTVLALGVGHRIFSVTAESMAPDFTLLWASTAAAPACCAVACFMPAMGAVVQDPVVCLRSE